MDREKILNTVTRHLLWQDKKATGPTGCRYKIDGLKCAIGCLIPDGHKAESFVGATGSLIYEYPDLAKLWEVESDSDINFLNNLQKIHDNYRVDSWKKQLAEVDCG